MSVTPIFLKMIVCKHREKNTKIKNQYFPLMTWSYSHFIYVINLGCVHTLDCVHALDCAHLFVKCSIDVKFTVMDITGCSTLPDLTLLYLTLFTAIVVFSKKRFLIYNI